jgi:hypothetical protein
MARDFENTHDLEDLSDDELAEVVRNHLRAHNALDIDELEVRAENGIVYLSGRVGTDEEYRIAEHVVTDVLGVLTVENGIFVDAVRRAESPEAIDEHLAEEDREEGVLLGDRAVPLSPEVEQTTDRLDEQLYGTSDVQKATEAATAWIPPESPTPEGPVNDRDFGEDH